MKLYNGDSCEILKTIPAEYVDLTVTSPPYDNLRTYEGITWNFDIFKQIADELYRVTKQGGAVVWIVNDATIDGSETGTSFRQALYFKEIGFNIHDTMIWKKFGTSFPETNRYYQNYEYMFVFSKGMAKTTNLIKDRKNSCYGHKVSGGLREADGHIRKKTGAIKGQRIDEFGIRYNVWEIRQHAGTQNEHPAMFPVQIAKDHIISWSNAGDTVLDPFMGSGTTGVACKQTQRDFIGIEISEKYFNFAKDRIGNTPYQTSLFEEVI